MRISEIPHVEHGRIAVCGCGASFHIDDSTVVEELSLPDLPPPETIGRYRIVRYVGRGAVNCVYEAVHPDLGVRVAIKTLHPEYAGDKPSREQFARAAKVYAKAVHPNIVKVYETGRTADGVPFIAMEFLPGGSLADLMLGGKIFSPREAAEIGAEICRALTVTAELGIVHRDIKPDNIMLADDRHCRLTDLGLAKFDTAPDAGNEACVLDRNEQVKPKRKKGFGTLEYMSPEQHLDAESCDIRSDIYSLGVTLYQLAAGRLPFETQTRNELRHMHLTVEPLVPSTFAPEIPIDFDYIVMHCIQKRTEDRYQTPSELLADLEAFLAGAPLPSTTAGAVPLAHTRFNVSASEPGARRKWILPAMASLLVLLILAAAATLLKERAGNGQNAPRTQTPEKTAGNGSSTGNAAGAAAFLSDDSGEKAQTGQSAGFPQAGQSDLNKFLPGGELTVSESRSEEPETDPEHIEFFEIARKEAVRAMEERSGFKNAIENLKGLKGFLFGKYAVEADGLIEKLEKEKEAAVEEFMRKHVADADPLIEEGKLNEAVTLCSAAMRVHAPAQEFKDACREKIAEIVGIYMAPFDRDAAPLIAAHEFDRAVNHYIDVRTTMRDNSLAQEFQDACTERINEIKRFKEDAFPAFEQAMAKLSGFEAAEEKLNGFRSSTVCAGEAERLIDELEEAEKNAPRISPTPDPSVPAAEEGGIRQ